jgi:hypothetical protein
MERTVGGLDWIVNHFCRSASGCPAAGTSSPGPTWPCCPESGGVEADAGGGFEVEGAVGVEADAGGGFEVEGTGGVRC